MSVMHLHGIAHVMLQLGIAQSAPLPPLSDEQKEQVRQLVAVKYGNPIYTEIDDTSHEVIFALIEDETAFELLGINPGTPITDPQEARVKGEMKKRYGSDTESEVPDRDSGVIRFNGVGARRQRELEVLQGRATDTRRFAESNHTELLGVDSNLRQLTGRVETNEGGITDLSNRINGAFTRVANLEQRRKAMHPALVAALLILGLGLGLAWVQWGPWGRSAATAARVAELEPRSGTTREQVLEIANGSIAEATRNFPTREEMEAAVASAGNNGVGNGITRAELEEAIASIQFPEGGTPARAEPDPNRPAAGAVSSAQRDRDGVYWVRSQTGDFVGVPADVDLQVGMELDESWNRRDFEQLNSYITDDS